MIVDDRLETVLRTVAAGPSAVRTQFRQLADILGRTPAESWSAAHVEALERIDSLQRALDDAASAALLGTCSLRSPILVEHFAELGPKTALAAITRARLREAEWLQLIPELPVQARGFLRHRRDLGPPVQALLARFGITDFALPQPALPQSPLPQPVQSQPALTLPADFEPLVSAPQAATPSAPAIEPQPAASQTAAPPTAAPQRIAVPAPSPLPSSAQAEGIGAIVRRIEAFRRTREEQTAGGGITAAPAHASSQSRLPFADDLAEVPHKATAIDLRLDGDGTITAAEAPYAAMLVGMRPFTADPHAPAACDAASIRAVRARQPLDAGIITIDGAATVAGTWRIDAAPLFAPDTGRFMGYHARLRRPLAAPSLPAANAEEKGGNADQLRQMLHELRTPINAIQGFAELIQQQMLGPTPHQYRSLAASIASDSARMLGGFEDIERLAGLESEQFMPKQVSGPRVEADLTALLGHLLQQLEPVIAPREIRLRCDVPDGPMPVAMEPADLERTLWRLFSLIGSSAAPGERLSLSLGASDGQARLKLPLPAMLAMRDDAALFAPETPTGGATMLGSGFALRLAAAEIRAAGGVLTRRGAQLDIALPLLTGVRQPPSQAEGPADEAGMGQTRGSAGLVG